MRLLQEAGSDIPIESFILVIASAQWIVGPVLAYAGLSNHYKMHMYVPEAEYMTLAVPGVIFIRWVCTAFVRVKELRSLATMPALRGRLSTGREFCLFT